MIFLYFGFKYALWNCKKLHFTRLLSGTGRGCSTTQGKRNILRNDGAPLKNEAWMQVPEKSRLVFQGLVLLEKNTVKQLSFKQFLLWKRSWLFSDSQQSCQQSSRVANYAVVFRAVLFLFVACCRPCAIFHKRNIFMPHQHYWISLDMIIFQKIIGRRCRSFLY